MTATAARHITFEEFLADETIDPHSEWVGGKVVAISPVTTEHGRVADWLGRVLATYVELRDLGEVLREPVAMKLDGNLPGRLPDVFFVHRDHADRIQADAVYGPADLAVEVVSPGSRAVDRGDKFDEYERGGVREYWIVDPDRRQAEFNQLDDQGRYQLVRPDAEGVYHSREIEGLWIKEAWLWQRPLPTLVDILRQWELV